MEAVEHLFSVGCGLDSQIVGDFEIIGQIKKSFSMSKELKAAKVLLDRLVSLVIKASKRIKSETQLSTGATSVAFSGVQYIRGYVEELGAKNILLFGIGKMGRNTCENLVKHSKHKSITLINRNAEKAELLSKKYQVVSRELGQLQEELDACDILFVATGSPVHTITPEMLKRRKPILILDLSLPRNVDPEVGKLENVQLVHLDELSKLANETLEGRLKHLPHAKEILAEEFTEFEEWVDSRKYVPVLHALNNQLKGFKDNELNKLFRDVDEDHHESLRLVTDKLVHKITGKIALHLRSKNTEISAEIKTIQDIFQLDRENKPI
jgi:glutamyl-tRNA reductase